MIRRLGSHEARRALFGYDRYLLPDLEEFRSFFALRDAPFSEHVSDPLHYLSSAALVCEALQTDEDAFGVLCCYTGMGMSIAANKFAGVYAARCTSVEDAVSAREINNANVLCIASKEGLEKNLAILEAFVSTPYNGRRLEQLEQIDMLDAGGASALPALRAMRLIA